MHINAKQSNFCKKVLGGIPDKVHGLCSFPVKRLPAAYWVVAQGRYNKQLKKHEFVVRVPKSNKAVFTPVGSAVFKNWKQQCHASKITSVKQLDSLYYKPSKKCYPNAPSNVLIENKKYEISAKAIQQIKSIGKKHRFRFQFSPITYETSTNEFLQQMINYQDQLLVSNDLSPRIITKITKRKADLEQKLAFHSRLHRDDPLGISVM